MHSLRDLPGAPGGAGLRVAVVGAGIAGLGTAWLLHRRHAVTVYDAGERPGGHAHTVDVPLAEGSLPVDVGFIVYNELNYPNLSELFRRLRVPTAASDMSLAVSIDGGRIEYSGSPRGLIAQPGNAIRPGTWRMLRDIRRFYREAPRLLDDPARAGDAGPGLGDYLAEHRYSTDFVADHLLPMGAAIWSSTPERMLAFPAVAFVRFCHNHGLLRFAGRPRWRTVAGGSRAYVDRLCSSFADRLRLGTRVVEARRHGNGIELRDSRGGVDRFDRLVLATHADQALAILGASATEAERAVLGAFRYEANPAYLHRDRRLMPRRRAVWSSWNCLATDRALGRHLAVTYWMNRLQPLGEAPPIFVTLNPETPPAEEATLARFEFAHPQFDAAALRAQQGLPALQGHNGTWFCGSYWGYGFHEDALRSGLDVATALGAPAPWHPAAAGGGTAVVPAMAAE